MAFTQRAGELKAEGVDIISFSAGEPDFDTPAHIVEAAKKALDQGMTRYTPVTGTADLREAIAEETFRATGVTCSPDQVITTVGAKHALYGFFQAVLNPGDEVLIPAPYWVSYPDQVRLAGGAPVIVETGEDTGFLVKPEMLRKAITPKTKVLVLNDPCNPSGAVYTPQAVRELTTAAVDAGLYVLTDEVYRELIYDDATHTSPLSVVPEDKRAQVFTVDGVSKTYAMTGWRIGWGVGDPEIVRAIAKIQGQSTSNPTSVAQAAALAALKGANDFLRPWKEQYRLRRNTMVNRLNGMPGVSCFKPGGAFYVLPSFKGVLKRIGDGVDDISLTTHFLEQARVTGVPGTPFGASGHIRFSYAATSLEAIEIGLNRIEEAVAQI
ncbi:MAG: pyridoxal phosphate-dependent aminotransferase [Proteobacteria bacterium]|nr:pyridoxal phosphate-dependent aminotransferase [Pseudomonadota bacterium]